MNLAFSGLKKMMKDLSMKEIYAMRRANGDWFALESQGRLRVPLFHSSQDAMMARLRNFGMLLFKPVALDIRLLKTIAGTSGGAGIDFCMVNDPFSSLNRCSRIEQAQLALQIGNREEHQSVPSNGNGPRHAGLNTLSQSELWN